MGDRPNDSSMISRSSLRGNGGASTGALRGTVETYGGPSISLITKGDMRRGGATGELPCFILHIVFTDIRQCVV